MTVDADSLIRTLELTPHPEGGFFKETFRASLSVDSSAHSGARAASTAIYFLLRADDFSAFHRVCSDEVWHHYLGDPLTLFMVDGQGNLSRVILGNDLTNGQRPQWVVPRDVLQAARVARGEELGQANPRHGFTLCGCTVAPGFEFGDFELPSRSALRAAFPAHGELIDTLTR